jgi:phage terminase small subunit
MTKHRYPTGAKLMALRYPHLVNPGATLPRPAGKLPQSPPHLEDPEKETWTRLVHEHQVDDAVGRVIVTMIAQAEMRVRHFREIIDREGEMIVGDDGKSRRHPLLNAENSARASLLHATRTLMKHVSKGQD